LTTTTRRSLGRGLDAVLGVADKTVLALKTEAIPDRELKTVMVQTVIPGQYQPRREFDDASLQELANSIKEKGILQPIITRRAGHDYEIIAGERRWRAAQMAGLQQVPIIVCDIDNASALAFGLIENIQRKDLNPIEEAQALQRLIDEFTMTHEQVAKAVGRSRVAVTNLLRLLGLSETVKAYLMQGKIDMGHARALLALPEEEQGQVAEVIVSRNLTVREAEAVIRRNGEESRVAVKSREERTTHNPTIEALEKEITDLLGTNAKISVNAKGEGRVILPFKTMGRLMGLMRHLRGVDDSVK